MSDRLFKVKAYAEDAMSAEKRNEFQKQIEGEVIAKPLFNQIQEDFGINVFQSDPDQLPESDEEMELVHEYEVYKPAVEIAEEVAINTLYFLKIITMI